MTHVIVYYIVLSVVAAFAVLRGGKPERLVAQMFIAASLATTAVSYTISRNYGALNVGVFLIDLALLAGLFLVAIRAYRLWPIPLLAIQLLTTAVHGARAYDPAMVRWVYAGAVAKLAYPALCLLVLGTFRHRWRVRQSGTDTSWLRFSVHSEVTKPNSWRQRLSIASAPWRRS